MLQLENIENAYSFHSYDEHSAKLITPDKNIHSNSPTEDNLLEIKSTTFIYQELIESELFPSSFESFDENCINELIKHDAEIFLIGTGSKSRFPKKEILQFIAKNKLSIDFMDTGAASRTFNILTAEQRKVAALIFFK
ncbi:MAG: Mth938-like domain-containing protein [Gammaproteobacteria bacterium]|nr:Mth938-like domain-containing protein [Gammaproteobacteria bacterium]